MHRQPSAPHGRLKMDLRGQFFHTNWTGHGGTTASSTYNV
jgi:hypothetical protein